jgi:hypothetical protein
VQQGISAVFDGIMICLTGLLPGETGRSVFGGHFEPRNSVPDLLPLCPDFWGTSPVKLALPESLHCI